MQIPEDVITWKTVIGAIITGLLALVVRSIYTQGAAAVSNLSIIPDILEELAATKKLVEDLKTDNQRHGERIAKLEGRFRA